MNYFVIVGTSNVIVFYIQEMILYTKLGQSNSTKYECKTFLHTNNLPLKKFQKTLTVGLIFQVEYEI